MTKRDYTTKPLPSSSPYKPEETSFYNMPDSPASNLVLDVLGAGADIGDLPDRKKQINRNTDYEVLENGNKRLISLKNATGTAEVTIELSDIDKLTGSNKPAKKLFVLSLIKANEQAIHEGQLTKDYVTFPLQELVGIGFYTALRSARAGFNAGVDTLTSLKIKGKTRKKKHRKKKESENIIAAGKTAEAATVAGKPAEQAEAPAEKQEPTAEDQKPAEAEEKVEPVKVKVEVEETEEIEETTGGKDVLEVLFTGGRIEKGQCFIYLNPRINWSFLTQYFTILPTYYFRLSNRASDLLYYIFYLARQHTRDIEERGYFTISFRAIQHKLSLPSEKGAANPQRDIKDAIEDTIEQIEDAHKATYDNMEFSLLPVCDDTAPITDYLDNGYLKVELKGAFASNFIAISKETEKQIAEAKKRQQKIQEKAIAIATAKKLEKKESGTE